MQSRSLRAFLALYQLGTVAAAAQAVHLSPAAVSAQLKKLEEDLDTELFIRTGRSISLNARAYQLVPLVQKMLDIQAEIASLGDQQSLKGRVALGVITSTLAGGLPGVLKRMRSEHPQLELRVTAHKSPELAVQVATGLLDAAIITTPPPHAASPFCLHTLYTEPLALVMSIERRFSGIKHALESNPYIAFDRTTWVGGLIEGFIMSRGISVRPVMELDSHDAVLSVVRHDIGVAILPVLLGYGREDKSLQFIDLPGVQRQVCLAVRVEKNDSKATQVLLNYFREFGAYAPHDQKS